MSMMLPFGRNLNAPYSPPRRGGEAAPSRKCREATNGAQTARSASAIARSRNSGRFGWPLKGCRTDHPVRDKSERIHFFDVADSPPLRGGECAAPKTCLKN